MIEAIKNKKVLIFGLGILGGGVEAAKWFYKNKAKILITDKKTKKELLPSIQKLKKIKAKYVLGKHRFKDIDSSDIVYFNPGVSYKSEWVKYAKEKGKEALNDCYLFFKYAKGDIIAITGTRGKTTTTTWIYELLKQVYDNYPNNLPNRLPESSDRIESTRIIRPNNNYPNKRPNNTPEYKPNNNRIEYLNNNQIFGPNSGNSFGQHSGSDIKFGNNSCNLFGQNSGSKNIFGQNSGRDILLGGNQPEKSLFKILDKTKENSISVLEISSFQLEFYEIADERGYNADKRAPHQNKFDAGRPKPCFTLVWDGLQRRSTRIDNNIADQILSEQSVLSQDRSVSTIKAPKIAIITNIYNDHLNRYSNFEEYASIKARIFQNQIEEDFLILNLDNEWTNFFLNLKPKSQVYFVSLRGLSQTKRRQFGQVKVRGGIYIKDEKVFICDTSPGLEPDMLSEYQPDGTPGLKPDISGDHPGNLYGRHPGKILDNKSGKHLGDKFGNHPGKSIIFRDYELFSIKKIKEIYGEHNLYNLLFALLTVYLYLKSKNITNPQDKIKKLKNFILNLKTPEFRQEIIYKNKNLMIVNDSAATSPDATINAIERFKKYIYPKSSREVRKSLRNLILITGGTDKNLDFKDLAKNIKKEIKPENLILFDGSGTKKLIEELRKIKYPLVEENIFEDLKGAVYRGLTLISNLPGYQPDTTPGFKPDMSGDHPGKLLNNKSGKHRGNSSVILFSPASASFEKFKNEFDRGKKFNKIVKFIVKFK